MNTTQQTSIEEENTARLTAHANRLGYCITVIDTAGTAPSITIIPAESNSDTPALIWDNKAHEWLVQVGTHAWFTSEQILQVGQIQSLADGYARAVAMISALNTATDFAPYSLC